MAHEIAACATMQHRGMGGSHACLARAQRLAWRERDRGIRTLGQEHDDAAIVFELEDGAEEVAGPEIRHPGQRALDDVTALDLASLQFELLDPEEALHWVGQTRAAEN